MRYEIKGGSFPIVVCSLENGEQMITERGSMVWMSPNLQMETRGGGLGKMFSKALAGESMFQNIYTAMFHIHVGTGHRNHLHIMAFLIEKEAIRLGSTAKVHIKLDTGMNRIGLRTLEEAKALSEALEKFLGENS